MNPTEPKRSTTIKYIDPQVPQTELPAYAGNRYEATVPDTLDLQAQMASLAINGLTGPTDPEADYEIYWQVAFNTNPPVMWHAESDCVQAKHMEALPLLRLASGSRQNLHVEKRWTEVLRQMQGPDGLLYFPKIGRPWCVFGTYGQEPPGDHYFSPWQEGRLLAAMTIYYLLTGEDAWKDAGRKVVDGLNALAIHEDNKAHFPANFIGVGGKFKSGDGAAGIHNPASWISWMIQGLANYGKHAEYQPALDLAGELSRWVIEDANHFDATGCFLPEYSGAPRAHFHGHTMNLLSVLEYGTAAEDAEAIQFADRGFKYAMSQGDCLLGFFGEWLNMSTPQTLEMCTLADMIALAIKLSLAGTGDYWDMVDRWTRNLFVEGQLTSAHRAHWLASKTATTPVAPMQLPPFHNSDQAIEKNIGGFGYSLAPNDFVSRYPYGAHNPALGIIHCCTGNGARTIYYLWENILAFTEGRLQINLLLNRASKWADVDSHIPYTGQVDVTVKQPLQLSMRIPEWVTPEQATCTVNAQPRSLGWKGRYAQIGDVEKGDVVILCFPITETAETIDVEKRTYRVLLRGNTCVAIDPPGVDCPLFERDFYRSTTTRWHKVTRFVADKVLDW